MRCTVLQLDEVLSVKFNCTAAIVVMCLVDVLIPFEYMVGNTMVPNVIDSFEQEELSISLVIFQSTSDEEKRSKVNKIKANVRTK